MMQIPDISQLQYPIGTYDPPDPIDSDQIETWIEEISEFPELLKQELSRLTEEELAWRYRPGGWTIRQLVHHCADSHMNSLTRFKWCLTEEVPTIKPYLEADWAELPDTAEANIDPSLMILEGLHRRWVILLNSLTKEQLKRKFWHPEAERHISLDVNIGLYAWHSAHHLAHVKLAKTHRLTE